MSEELKPCPFCGRTPTCSPRTCDKNTPYNPADRAFPRVRCACGASQDGTDWTGVETAIAAWNHRTPPEVAAAPAAPIDMVLHCPACGMQHIDAPEPARFGPLDDGDIYQIAREWTNPLHRTHLCHGCSHQWRPADVPTNGVAAVKTKGKDDSPIVVKPIGEVVVTKNDRGQIVAVTRQDEEGRILSIISESAPATIHQPTNVEDAAKGNEAAIRHIAYAEGYRDGKAFALPATDVLSGWRPMKTAPKDGTLLRLLVAFTEHPTEDTKEPSPTIGANSLVNTGMDEWLFAGWSWEQDCFTQGEGVPVGWLPFAAQGTDAPLLKNLQTWLLCRLIGNAIAPEVETIKGWIAALAPITGDDIPSFGLATQPAASTSAGLVALAEEAKGIVRRTPEFREAMRMVDILNLLAAQAAPTSSDAPSDGAVLAAAGIPTGETT